MGGTKAVGVVAAEVRAKTGIESPFAPLWLVRAAELLPCPEGGLPGGVYLEQASQSLYYDESVPDWQDRVASISAGVLLRRHGASDTAELRRQLASELMQDVEPLQMTA
jgi:hypothetical protein